MHNFKEIRITPNEDSTLKVKIDGVKFGDKHGDSNIGTVVYPRIKMHSTTFDMFNTHKVFDVEVLPDNDEKDVLFNLYVPEDEE